MFEKDLTKPIILEQHEALDRRLIKNHPKSQEVTEKLINLRSGYRGEKTLNYFLTLLPEKKYRIFHDIRLPIGKSFFQIDSLLFHEKFGIIIDAKNYGGTLHLDKYQLTQEINDNKKVYQNPLSQTNRHKILLKYLFEKNQIPFFPLENLVCITKPSAIINISTGYLEAEKKLCRAENLLMKIEDLERFYKKELLGQKSFGKIKRLLLNKHTPLRIDIFQNYGIKEIHIVTGVQCPKCFHIPMMYKGRSWECPACISISKEAHLPTIHDYFLLIKPSITNSELRKFLHLPSPRAAAYILSFLNLPSTGTNKGRIYHQP